MNDAEDTVEDSYSSLDYCYTGTEKHPNTVTA